MDDDLSIADACVGLDGCERVDPRAKYLVLFLTLNDRTSWRADSNDDGLSDEIDSDDSVLHMFSQRKTSFDLRLESFAAKRKKKKTAAYYKCILS